MALAIFDLDNTLIAGDSDHGWGQFLVDQGIVDKAAFERANDQFYQDYLNGVLDMDRYLEFSLAPLAQHPKQQLLLWREQFMADVIAPIMLEKAKQLVAKHREQGDTLLIITATNRFVTEPIAEALGIPHLIATEPEEIDGEYTGKVSGLPSFQEGKVTRLNSWLEETGLTLENAWFYSDSHNDLPLLERVDHPVAVDPDATLLKTAEERQWTVLSLR